jgi:hypothetical protein
MSHDLITEARTNVFRHFANSGPVQLRSIFVVPSPTGDIVCGEVDMKDAADSQHRFRRFSYSPNTGTVHLDGDPLQAGEDASTRG